MTPEERIARLEWRMDELQSQFVRATTRQSMRATHTCPMCGGGHILAVAQINESTRDTLLPLALGTERSFWTGTDVGDPLFVYVCVSCRFVEWYVHSIEHLKPDGKAVIEI